MSDPERPWTKYPIREEGDPDYKPWSCLRLETLYHVAHLKHAIRIIEDGWIKSGLVYDESKLNKHRISVVWLSPNDWERSIYGNIRFSIPFETVLAFKNMFWVEDITYPKQLVPRFLLTSKSHENLLKSENQEKPVLIPFNPSVKGGPIWRDEKGQFFFSSEYTIELMLEADIAVSSVDRIDFVDHHRTNCNTRKFCLYQKTTGPEAGGEFLAALLSRRGRLDLSGMTEIREAKVAPANSLTEAIRSILHVCEKRFGSAYGGEVTAESDDAEALVLGLLGMLYEPPLLHEYSTRLGKKFLSHQELSKTVVRMFAEATKLEASELYRYFSKQVGLREDDGESAEA